MSALTNIAEWLRCPVCHASLRLDGRTLACEARHSFDLARQGYANLLGHGAPKNADTSDMIAARDRFLSAGHYAPIAEAVAEAVADAGRVLEVGAGTGHYLAESLGQEAWGLATDVSVPAMKRAAKAHPRMGAIVADTWAGLPLKDDSVDALLCIFSPRNLDDFRRILRPGGRIIVVVPNTGHMRAVRERHGLMDVAEDKAQQLLAAFPDASSRRIQFDLDLDEQAATDLVGMGPNAHHADREIEAMSVNVDVTLLVAKQ